MQNPLPHIIRQHVFWVSPERCLFWEEENTLVLADLHLGKTGHFRREGIAVPQSIYKADLQRLIAQLYFFKVDRLIIVGDFTHSVANKELELFKKWRKDFSLLQIDLVKGNHDILSDQWYEEAGVTIHEKELLVKNFCFRHETKNSDPFEEASGASFVFSGHLHPGISLKGKGRQKLTFPCFHFTPQHCILPAFSRFTGTYKVAPAKEDTVYVITQDELVKIG